MFKQASGFHGKNIIVERVCCENPDGKVENPDGKVSLLNITLIL